MASSIHQFKDISDYLNVSNLQVQPKFSDFVMYDWEDINWHACVDDLPYRHHYFELVLEIDTDCNFTVDQFNFTSVHGQNTLFFISPYRLQSCQTGNGLGSHKGFTILFKPEFLHLQSSNTLFLRDFPFFNHLSSPGISLDGQYAEDMLEIFRKIKYEYDNHHVFSREVIKNYLHILLLKGKLLYRHQSPLHNGIGREQEIYNEFMLLVQNHYSEFDSVGEYANRMHISPKHLSETIKSISGQSALQVIHHARLHHAKALLRQTNMTVSQIAHNLNFNNPDYFSVFFKRHVGESPITFRNS